MLLLLISLFTIFAIANLPPWINFLLPPPTLEFDHHHVDSVIIHIGAELLVILRVPPAKRAGSIVGRSYYEFAEYVVHLRNASAITREAAIHIVQSRDGLLLMGQAMIDFRNMSSHDSLAACCILHPRSMPNSLIYRSPETYHLVSQYFHHASLSASANDVSSHWLGENHHFNYTQKYVAITSGSYASKVNRYSENSIYYDRCGEPADAITFSKHVVRWIYDHVVLQHLSTSGSVINIGAGDGPGDYSFVDPLWDSVVEHNLSGLYVECTPHTALRLRRKLIARGATNIVVDESEVTPLNIHQLLANYSSVDIVKIDIDSFDCDLAESILSVVNTKILVLELNGQTIPPPVLFNHKFNPGVDSFHSWPLNSCSLSYVVRLMRSFGMQLFKFNGQDSVFVNNEVARVLNEVYGIQLPANEFECFRDSQMWHRSGPPLTFVREWLFELDEREAMERIASNYTADATIRRGERFIPLMYFDLPDF